MGKRKHRTTDPDKIRKKIRRLERRLKESDSSQADYESDNSYVSDPSMRSIVSVPVSEAASTPEPVDVDTTPQDSPAVQVNESQVLPPEVPALPIEILEALGESKNKVEVYAPKIRDEISERWGKIVVEGLNRDLVQKLMEDIHIPENFKLLKAPELNPEIATVLSQSTKNRDKRLERSQNHLGKGIAAVTNLMSSLIEHDIDKTSIIRKLSEIGQLLLDLHCQNTFSRRKLIMHSLDKKFSDMIQGVQRDSSLFGENLGEKIKARKTAERSGLQVKRTFEPQQPTTSFRPNQPVSRQGNSKAPPRSREQKGKWAGARFQASSRTSRRAPTKNDQHKASNSKPHFRR